MEELGKENPLFFENTATDRFPRLQSVTPHLGSTNWTQRVIKTTAKDIKTEGDMFGSHGVNWWRKMGMDMIIFRFIYVGILKNKEKFKYLVWDVK